MPPKNEPASKAGSTAPNDLPKIYGAIAAVMGAVKAIGKDQKNKEQNYSFRGIDDLYNELHGHFAKEKIFFTSRIVEKTVNEYETKKGTQMTNILVVVEWKVFAEDGSFITTETLGEGMDSGDKSANKAMSGAYKYAMLQLFCIPTGEQPDSEFQSPQKPPYSERKAPPAGAQNPPPGPPISPPLPAAPKFQKAIELWAKFYVQLHAEKPEVYPDTPENSRKVFYATIQKYYKKNTLAAVPDNMLPTLEEFLTTLKTKQ